ncbi:hypothetical protein Q7C36_021449 [Tachysurus vachellii]|uniref:Uncharacterized protein n=1 Tax=Tachysurus vachellii TaxID=175792 RepID=A0AA88ITA9_TACVA|nr:hypothetical protein Q7C36_021449 [Tachysurus vachellii]
MWEVLTTKDLQWTKRNLQDGAKASESSIIVIPSQQGESSMATFSQRLGKSRNSDSKSKRNSIKNNKAA